MTEPTDQSSEDWWKSFHVLEMADVLLDRSEQQLRTTLEFVQRELGLKRDSHLFDQCCGCGSLSIPLALQGLRVTGCDLFEPYIARAREDAAKQFETGSSTPEFFCADAFKFVPSEPCDAVINWYSSFGYAADDATNQQMLDRAFESLKPGGRFALEIPNVPGLLRRFEPVLVQEGTSRGRAVRIVRTCEPDFELGLLRQTWEWNVEGETAVTRQSAVKMYLPNRVRELLLAAGFDSVRMFGSADGEPYEMDSPRLLVTSGKPA